jgi:hypothetical protein
MHAQRCPSPKLSLTHQVEHCTECTSSSNGVGSVVNTICILHHVYVGVTFPKGFPFGLNDVGPDLLWNVGSFSKRVTVDIHGWTNFCPSVCLQ